MSELTGHRDEEKGRLATAGGLLKSTHHIRIQGRNQLVLFKFEITGGKHIAAHTEPIPRSGGSPTHLKNDDRL